MQTAINVQMARNTPILSHFQANTIRNAKAIVPIDKCFCTASDLTFGISHRLGIPAPLTDPRVALALVGGVARASLGKVSSLRYAQDVGHFLSKGLIRKV